MNKLETQLKGFFNNKLILPKQDRLGKILVSLCVHRTVQAGCLDSLFKLHHYQSPRVLISNAVGDALIDRARSREASAFLKSDSDVCLFIDDDIQFLPEDAIKMCEAAYDLKGIVCGAYIIKREQFQWITAKPLPDSPPIIFSPTSPLTEVMWPGTGFLAFHRRVLQDLINEADKFPEYHPNHIDFLHPTDLKYWDFFLPMKWKHPNGDKLQLSEDWAFGEKCRTIGHKIWLDPTIRLTHWGTYGYTLDDLCRPERMHCEVIKYEDYKDKTLVPKDEGSQLQLEQVSA